MNTVWYFPLEPLQSRYTQQLSKLWMHSALCEEVKAVNAVYKDAVWDYIALWPDIVVPDDVQTGGVVLDSIGRSQWSLAQCQLFLDCIAKKQVNAGDVLFFQDFFTPGVEALLYSLHLQKIPVRIFSMLHAQSVDVYDFTFPMRDWLRFIELGYEAQQDGIFVGSTVHKELLRESGFTAPVHVVGLPFGYEEVKQRMPVFAKRKRVIFTSRLDAEKQPLFLLKFAEKFLDRYRDWEFVVTTSKKTFTSNQEGAVEALRSLARAERRFQMKEGLTKDQYYAELAQARLHFNCSLQDFVSWTLLEACTAGCDLVYPKFRSFPECVPFSRLYEAFDVDSALDIAQHCMEHPNTHFDIPQRCDVGRKLTARIVVEGAQFETNIWE